MSPAPTFTYDGGPARVSFGVAQRLDPVRRVWVPIDLAALARATVAHVKAAAWENVTRIADVLGERALVMASTEARREAGRRWGGEGLEPEAALGVGRGPCGQDDREPPLEHQLQGSSDGARNGLGRVQRRDGVPHTRTREGSRAPLG